MKKTELIKNCLSEEGKKKGSHPKKKSSPLSSPEVSPKVSRKKKKTSSKVSRKEELTIISDYSEKSIAIIGYNKDALDIYKEQFPKKGRFNKNLSIGAGWIFKADHFKAIKDAFNEADIDYNVTTMKKYIKREKTVKELLDMKVKQLSKNDMKYLCENYEKIWKNPQAYLE